MPEPTIRSSDVYPVTQPIHMRDLGRAYSSAYVSFEFSLTPSFKKSDLVMPTDGRTKIEASEQGIYWGLADTANNSGTIRFNSPSGDYERVSIGGIVDEMRFTPIAAITGANYWRAIVQRA